MAGEDTPSHEALEVISRGRRHLDHVVGVIPRLGLAESRDSHVTLAVDVGVPALEVTRRLGIDGLVDPLAVRQALLEVDNRGFRVELLEDGDRPDPLTHPDGKAGEPEPGEVLMANRTASLS